MSNSSNDVKSTKPVFSYARAAQGSSTPTPTAVSPQLNGKQAPTSDNSLATSGSGAIKKDDETTTETANAPSQNSTNHKSQSSVSSATGSQPAWAQAGSGVHMPPRSVPTTTNSSNPVQFGNFVDEATIPNHKSPTVMKATVQAASGGTAPPAAIVGKDVPQFGSVPATNSSTELKPISHSRSNSNASDLRPNMSPNPPFSAAYPSSGPQFGQFSPAMPNYRGRGGGMNQYQNRGGARNVPGPRNNTQSPMNSPQQSHVMGSPMGSPAMYGGYMPPQQMYPGYGGYSQQYAYNQGQYYPTQHMAQNYVNPQAGRGPSNYSQQHQYQNPNLQASSGTTMSRSGSTASERPPATLSGNGPNGPTTATAAPAFTTPRKKGSSAIRIVDPNSKSEVVLPKSTAPAEIRRETTPAPSPKLERAISSAPARPLSAASSTVTETDEQRKSKQDAARQAVLDKIAASRAAEQSVQDEKAKVEKAARDAEDAANREKAAAEAKAAQEKAEAAAEAAKVEEERVATTKRIAEEQEAAEKAAAEEKAALEKKVRREEDEARVRKETEARAEAETLANQQKEAEAKRAADDAAAAADKDRVDAEAQVSKVSDEEKSTLDTIVEPISQGQKEDIIETKTTDDTADSSSINESKDRVSDTTKADSKKRDSAVEVNEPVAKIAPSAMTTALKTSRRISDVFSIIYPSGVNAPSKDINKSSKDGKCKYDKEFLLQFQKVFIDKPTFDWDDVIKASMRDPDSKSGKGPLGNRSGSNRGNASPFGGLPSFNAKPLKSSDERFQQAERMRAAGIDPKEALSGSPSFERGSNYKPSISRKESMNASSPRTESKRGGKGGRAVSNRPEKAQVGAPTIAPEDVKPLANSGNRWTPKRAAEVEPLPGVESTAMAPEIVQRKVKGLLNKLTLDNFDRITDQILEIASQSKDESDGRTLRQVIALTFEKATDEAHFSNMYARFCRKMMECTSEEVKDEGITDKHGNQVVGGTLFRKYLLSRCQEDFERGWKTDLPPKPDGEPQSEEAAMLSDEYYIAAAAKRRGLGLVRFIGELFLLQMLNEKIMQECIRKLLANVVDPEEEEIESLSKLVETVGSALDSTDRGREIMNVYMQRMQQLTTCDSLSSRIKFMVLDVLDLRKAGWIGNKTDKGPKTIQQIHDEAAQAAALKESQRGPSHRGGMGGMGAGSGRPDFGRGDARNMSRRQDSHGPALTTGADGWSTLKASATRDMRVGDLTKFGKFGEKRTASAQSTFGPGGNLSQATRTNSNQVSRNPSHSGISREDSRASQAPSNPFAALEGESGDPSEAQESAGQEAASERPRLNLLPKGATDGSASEGVARPDNDNNEVSIADEPASEDTDSVPMPGEE